MSEASQPNLLHETLQGILKRLATIELLVDKGERDDLVVQKSLRKLQAEIEELKKTVYGDAVPRRCSFCFRVAATYETVCATCGKTL